MLVNNFGHETFSGGPFDDLDVVRFSFSNIRANINVFTSWARYGYRIKSSQINFLLQEFFVGFDGIILSLCTCFDDLIQIINLDITD